MDLSFGEYLYSEMKISNYTIIIIVVCQALAIITNLKYWQKDKSHILILVYTLFGFFLFTLGQYLTYKLKQSNINTTNLNESLNCLYAATEFLVFAHVLNKETNSSNATKITHIFKIFIFIITPLYLILININIFGNSPKRYLADSLSFVEISFIGILILLYFINLFKSSPNIDLKKSPIFWLCSFSILYTISLPVSILLLEYFRHENRVIFRLIISLHYLSLSIVYLGIIKFIICRKAHIS